MGVQVAFRGFYTARFLKSMLGELFTGSGNVDIETRVRSDNSSVVENAQPTNTVTKNRRLNGLLESNREELETDRFLGLSHIAGPLNISGEMAKSTPQTQLILLLFRNICHTVSGKANDAIMRTYPSADQYLAFPETKAGLNDSNTSARRRGGADSWDITKSFVLF